MSAGVAAPERTECMSMEALAGATLVQEAYAELMVCPIMPPELHYMCGCGAVVTYVFPCFSGPSCCTGIKHVPEGPVKAQRVPWLHPLHLQVCHLCVMHPCATCLHGVGGMGCPSTPQDTFYISLILKGPRQPHCDRLLRLPRWCCNAASNMELQAWDVGGQMRCPMSTQLFFAWEVYSQQENLKSFFLDKIGKR